MASLFEGVTLSGRWVWKDDPTKPGLEFNSNNPNAERQDKRRRGRGVDGRGRGDRVSSGAQRGGVFGRGRGATSKILNKWAPNKKDQTEHSAVTLEDIKTVTFERMSEVHAIPEEFHSLFGREQFNIFLLYLMSYFNCYFNKLNLETKKNPMYIEPSISEKLDYANACDRLNVAQMLLGRSYCILVLGLGLQDQHHMECGRSRVSKTYTDRSLYETFYRFCTFLVWITFRRRDYDAIEKEIGRILRSNTFNPAIRVKYSAAEPKEPDPTKAQKKEEEKKEEEKKKLYELEKITPAEYRRLHPKRPAIKTIVNQRSPAIVSIIPSPREEAAWLFKKTQPQNKDQNKSHDEARNVEEQYSDLIIDVNTFKVGILGEPYKMFNPLTLSPIGTENEEETNDAGEKELSEDSVSEQKSPMSERGLSRQQTAISHATTEAMTDDES
ncbi:protein phosphatase 1 regulatory subunit 36-like [Biomphalaria glabrata]|uniref:Protein phosphatase 1 regulatory subunit 36-like n=1 Tax=Biomphalaria glabrata TaxID=6526 RepID=A0A9W2ZTK0_BIOGL|nr:protein phosphatase 1 regulatory subunit 36-like [Biomphalaria glabrata]